MASDAELLRRYAETKSEEAFAELVRRHLNLVFSAALRQVHGDSHLAQDVVQTVFRDLAVKGPALLNRPLLTGWLYTSTRFAAAKAVRTEQRRRAREQEAQAMQQLLGAPAPGPDWENVQPVLDEAMHELKTSERDVLLMRYFENHPLAVIGERFGLCEDAARKRVERALEKLRAVLGRRGITTTATLATAISTHAVQVAPAGLFATLPATALAGAATVSGSSVVLYHLFTMTKLKLSIISLLAVAGVATPLFIQHQSQVRLRNEIQSLQTQLDGLGRVKRENGNLTEQLAQMEKTATDASNRLNDLLRLRNENGALRQRTNELAALQAENRRLQAARRASPGNGGAESEMAEPVPRETWAFMGYATPEATAQSLLWALREGNTNAYQAYLNGLAPEQRAVIEREAAARGGPTAFAELGSHETGGMADYRIVRKIELSDDRVLLQVQPGAGQPVQTFVMKKIGEEWKMADPIR